jgi:cytochrome c oxidase subunit 2
MIGSVHVMEPADYQAWLSGGGIEGTLVERGERLFTDMACGTCHLDTGRGRGPSLKDIFGTQVTLADGSTALADEGYLRESIINSQARIVQGYQPLMPAFQGLVSEDNLVALVEYVKSLSPTASTTRTPPTAVSPAPQNPPPPGKRN